LRTEENLYEDLLRQGQIRHALKTALACCLAITLTHFFHFASVEFAPIFAFMLMTLGMPSPRLSAILGQFALVISALISAFLVIALHDAPYLFLAVTLLWIFSCLLFANWFPLPASMGSMVSAIGIFAFFAGTVGETLTFYFNFVLDWLVGGSSVLIVTTLIWPHSAEKVLLQRLAAVYTHLEKQCRQATRQIRAGASPQEEASVEKLAPLPPLPAPELPRARDPSNPLARMSLACRALHLHLWFFQRVIIPVLSTDLSAETCRQLAGLFDQCAEHLHALVDGILRRKEVPVVDTGLLQEARSARWEVNREKGDSGSLLAQGVHQAVLSRLIHDLQTVTASHNALLPGLRGGLAGELSALEPSATRARLIDINSLRRSTKLVLILLLCLAEQHALSFPGGVQVAFFAVFFASVGNVGRQVKTDLLGLLGVLAAWTFGIAAVFLTSKLPRFPLLLSLAFLGEFLAILTFLKLPRYGIAGLQGGLALPFAFLTSTGPSWGTFVGARTRLSGIVVAGFTALVIHAFLWPVLPMRRLRALIAAALRDTAVSLGQLVSGDRSTWKGSPPGLHAIVAQAHELLDDARYLPGSDGVDPNYFDILGCLQEIDACVEYLNLVISLEQEHPLRQRFFQVIDDYSAQAGSKLQEVAQQFQPSPPRAGGVEPVRWQPDISARWKNVIEDVAPIPDGEIDPRQLAVIARCLEQIASAVERISRNILEINVRNEGS